MLPVAVETQHIAIESFGLQRRLLAAAMRTLYTIRPLTSGGMLIGLRIRHCTLI